MPESGSQGNQRQKNELAFHQPWMRDLEVFFVELLLPKEEQVNIEGTCPPEFFAFAAFGLFEGETEAQQLTGVESRLEPEDRIQVVGLAFRTTDRGGLVEWRRSTLPDCRVLTQPLPCPAKSCEGLTQIAAQA